MPVQQQKQAEAVIKDYYACCPQKVRRLHQELLPSCAGWTSRTLRTKVNIHNADGIKVGEVPRKYANTVKILNRGITFANMAVQDVLVWVNRGTFKSNVVQNLDLLSKAFVLWGCFLINVRSSALLWHQEKKSPDFNAILHVWLVATFFGGGEYLEDGFDVWGPKLCCDPTGQFHVFSQLEANPAKFWIGKLGQRKPSRRPSTVTQRTY